jgi:hypothetical protein
MKKFKDDNLPSFVLCRSQHQQKTVCVVLDADGNTLQVICLTSQQSFNADFRNIWEMILDAPLLSVELGNSLPIPYATAANLRKFAVGRAA